MRSFSVLISTATIRAGTRPPCCLRALFIATPLRPTTAICPAGGTCTVFSNARTAGHHRAGEACKVFQGCSAIDPHITLCIIVAYCVNVRQAGVMVPDLPV
jgi:hypothetical protein